MHSKPYFKQKTEVDSEKIQHPSVSCDYDGNVFKRKYIGALYICLIQRLLKKEQCFPVFRTATEMRCYIVIRRLIC